jgi:hypothetical protein
MAAEQVIGADNTCASQRYAACKRVSCTVHGQTRMGYHCLQPGQVASVVPLLGLVLRLNSGVRLRQKSYVGKYVSLIQSLSQDRHFDHDAYNQLVKADNRVVRYLTNNLLTNPDPDIRETCAEILRDRKQARAVPFLIEALKDEELFVRQDALWAIGPLCGLEITMLETLLGITNMDSPKRLYRKVSQWWRSNKKYIENNYSMW